jgi:hypothetical protein
LQFQQKAIPHWVQCIDGHPPFFSIRFPHCGHGLVLSRILFSALSSSSTWSLIRSWYCSHVSPSCHGRSQETQAFAPHLTQVQMSDTGEEASSGSSYTSIGGFFFLPRFDGFAGGFVTLFNVGGEMWIWPASQPEERHQRQLGVESPMNLRSSSSNLEGLVSRGGQVMQVGDTHF